ncbi:MAG: hypothetical protein PHE43_01285 [Candidatus Nanoarchaeia archaeon]|nr:hypothetical protein [Candidatus Nanoarchaeia archaeon]
MHKKKDKEKINLVSKISKDNRIVNIAARGRDICVLLFALLFVTIVSWILLPKGKTITILLIDVIYLVVLLILFFWDSRADSPKPMMLAEYSLWPLGVVFIVVAAPILFILVVLGTLFGGIVEMFKWISQQRKLKNL